MLWHTRWLRRSAQNILPRFIYSAAPRAFSRNTNTSRVYPAGADGPDWTAEPDPTSDIKK